jgi:hypothetical protein
MKSCSFHPIIFSVDAKPKVRTQPKGARSKSKRSLARGEETKYGTMNHMNISHRSQETPHFTGESKPQEEATHGTKIYSEHEMNNLFEEGEIPYRSGEYQSSIHFPGAVEMEGP